MTRDTDTRTITREQFYDLLFEEFNLGPNTVNAIFAALPQPAPADGVRTAAASHYIAARCSCGDGGHRRTWSKCPMHEIAKVFVAIEAEAAAAVNGER